MYRPENLASIMDVDIYLVDQILKGRYASGQRILDAGVGAGRNLNWFLSEDFDVFACDIEPERQFILQSRYPSIELSWQTCDLAQMPFKDNFFDHILCIAVLHFANDEEHFKIMWSEIMRVVRPGGALFIRTCSNIGMEQYWEAVRNGRNELPDGSERFLLNKELLFELKQSYPFEYLEPLKSVNVADKRVMSTLVIRKT